MKKLQFILACEALTALSSCSSDDQSFDPNEIRITTGFALLKDIFSRK